MNPTDNNAKLRGGASTESNQPIRFGGTVLGAQRHICALFHTSDEEYRVLLPFIKDGFECGHKSFHIVDPKLRDEHRQRLAPVGIDVTAAEQSGQFDLRNWGDAYLRDGRFDQHRLLALAQEVLEGGRQHGFALTRMVCPDGMGAGRVAWCRGLAGYETRANYI